MRLIFCTSNHLTSKINQVATFSRWSHVEMCFSDSCVIGSSGHYGGVAEHTLSWVKADNTKWEMCNIDVPRPDLVRKFAQDQVGKKYDYSSPDKWFCSELVAAALQEGGVKLFTLFTLFRVPKHRVTPAMIYSSPLLY